MNIEILSALCTFVFVSSVTPGPNNLMLMTSGANFGIRRSLPHLFGVTFGFVFMLILLGVGLVQVFERFPQTYTALRLFSLGYLLYLAWKIAVARPQADNARGTPLNALQAALFQWVNPKAWAMALTAVTVYAPTQSLVSVAFVALVAALINLPSCYVWVVMGDRLRSQLQAGARLRLFNCAMALLLLVSLWPVLFGASR